MPQLPVGPMGYLFEQEDKPALEAAGESLEVMQSIYRGAFPEFNVLANPGNILKILNQLNQGACQGHSLAQIFSICYFLVTGRVFQFSRAAGYYLSQRKGGIRGDKGSALVHGNWVATVHGMCLEKDWPYPRSYDPREPGGIRYDFKIKSSKPLRSGQEIYDWLDLGLPVQTGMIWDSSCSQELVEHYNGSNPRTGGHSTVFWQFDAGTRKNVININSWDLTWNEDGMHEWTFESCDRAAHNPNNTFIGYAPDMDFPIPPELMVNQ